MAIGLDSNVRAFSLIKTGEIAPVGRDEVVGDLSKQMKKIEQEKIYIKS